MKNTITQFTNNQIVKFKFNSDDTIFEGKIIRDAESNTIYGGREIKIRPINKKWFGTVVIGVHGDYGSYKFEDIEYIK